MPYIKRIKPYLADAFFILLGVACAAFGLEGFLLPNHFIDGGVTGISLLMVEVFGWRLSLLLVIVNIPFLLLARVVIGRTFAIKTAVAIGLLALVIFFFRFPVLTEDKLLISIFGGLFLGAGIGLSMRGGSVLDGTEILAIYLSRRIGAKVSDWVILINVAIFGVAGTVLSIEQAMYSLITYVVASKALDFIIDGVEEYTGVTIISQQNETIRIGLIEKVNCGVTVYKGQGGYGATGGREHIHDVLYVVITRLEIRKLTLVVQEIDPKAFMVFSSISDVHGGMVKKRRV